MPARIASSVGLAASAVSRGTPGCVNTSNRVPEFPSAQDGSSMA